MSDIDVVVPVDDADPRAPTCGLWITAEEMLATCDVDLETVDQGLAADAVQAASDILFTLAQPGGYYPGECEDVVRPCARRSGMATSSRYRWGTWEWRRSWGFCGCRSYVECGCSGLSQVELATPVVDVTSVRVDGATLAPDAYRVDDWRWLVRIDGETWPCCQDLSLDADQEGTFEVTYTFGAAPPAGGVRSASVLACELLKAWSPADEDDCRLPKRVRQIVREGVTIAVDNPTEVFDDGMTGIPEVDLWLRSVNPKAPKSGAVFLSPDVRPSRRRRVDT